MTYKLTALLLVIILLGCNGKKINTDAEGKNLMQVSRDWSKSASTDSIEKIMSYWADSAILLSSQSFLSGKKEIRGMIEGILKVPGFKTSWEPISVSISESGDMGYMIEKNKITRTDSLGRATIKYRNTVTIWKKDVGGYWKNVVDIGVDAPIQNQ